MRQPKPQEPMRLQLLDRSPMPNVWGQPPRHHIKRILRDLALEFILRA